jgi:hypothetical protein
MDENIVILSRSDNKMLLYGTFDNPIDNYYFAVLYCVERIYNSEKIKESIDAFKRYCASKQKMDSVVSRHNNLEILISKKLLYVSSIILFCFAAFLIYEIANHISSRNEKPIVSNIQIINEDFFLPRKNIVSKINEAVTKQSRKIKFAVLIGRSGAGSASCKAKLA